jgi:HSP20 family protein
MVETGGISMGADEIKKTDKRIAAGRGESTRGSVEFIPQVDICEDKSGITVLADMPGVAREGVSIDLKEDQLTISGKVLLPEEKETSLHKEYEIGNYFRQFTLSDMIDREKITARMVDGVLTLLLPKAEKAVPKRIKVTTV